MLKFSNFDANATEDCMKNEIKIVINDPFSLMQSREHEMKSKQRINKVK